MSDDGPASFALDPLDRDDAAAAAFDRMGRRMASMAAAVEGFAARQQEIQGRDYTADLTEIHDTQASLKDAIQNLARRPAMAMTVERIAADIATAGTAVRKADHEGWASAERQITSVAHQLEAVVAGRLDLRKQSRWLAAAGLAILWVGFLLGNVVPPAIDRAVPKSWHWPEQRAAAALDMSGRDTGQRLLQIFDPKGWQNLLGASRIMTPNAATIADCGVKAAKRGVPVPCSILVSGPSE